MLARTTMVLRHQGGRTYVHDDGRFHHVRLDEDVWQDMGRPDTVTVTIEPGDQLNHDKDCRCTDCVEYVQ
jgi:hypothetical protein